MFTFTFSNSEFNSELENVNMTPYMYVFKKFISISEHFSNRIRGTHLADLTLLNTVACPSRYPMTCLILTSRLSGLKWTQF